MAENKNNDRDKELSKIIGDVQKKFGKEIIVGTKVDVEFTSTGCISADIALGGGLAKGRIVEIFGPESSGKTTFALHCCAEGQLNDMIVIYIDTENALDPDYAGDLGVEIDFDKGKDRKFILSQPNSAEEAIDLIKHFSTVPNVLIILDSVAALAPKARIQGDVGDSKIGLVARLMSENLPIIANNLKKSDSIAIFINQLREKIGVMFGSPETTTGGNALKFYASQRIDIRKIGMLKDGDEAYGNKVRLKVTKNKVAPPFKKAEFSIIYGEGIDKISDLIEIAVALEIINKSGSWYSYNGTKLGQGVENAKITILDNPELEDELRIKVYENLIGN